MSASKRALLVTYLLALSVVPGACTETPTDPNPIPQKSDPVVTGARFAEDPWYIPSFGDLWMPTWADDDRLYLTWGDGVGVGNGFPTGHPAYESLGDVRVSSCEEGDLFCVMWCAINVCDGVTPYPAAPVTDAGVVAFDGSPPHFAGVASDAIDVPSGEPFFLETADGVLDIEGDNDKPSSLLFVDGTLYFAGHRPAGAPVMGYLARSFDYGRSWTEIAGSPWGADSNFRVLMFVNMGRAYALNDDGYVYAFGVGKEAAWTAATVYLARTPRGAIDDYGAYEYLARADGDGPKWTTEQTGAIPIGGLRSTGQASAMYHEGSSRYLFLTTDGGFPEGPPGLGALYEAPAPWGPWTEVTRLCFDLPCRDGGADDAWADGKYIAGLIPVGAEPDRVYFTIAGGERHYQLQIGALALELKSATR